MNALIQTTSRNSQPITAHFSVTWLVVVFVMMPSGDGQQLATLLCKKNPKLPIVAMSGLATEQLQRETMKCGALAFLRKPFTAEQLLGVLSSALKCEPA